MDNNDVEFFGFSIFDKSLEIRSFFGVSARYAFISINVDEFPPLCISISSDCFSLCVEAFTLLSLNP